MRLNSDICVIGGGPAGSTAARHLASRGYRVLLLEGKRFPRPEIGVSLSPGAERLLADQGFGHLLEDSRTLRRGTSRIVWAGECRDGGDALVVDRGRLDEGLLAAAADAGVIVLQPAQALRIKDAGSLCRRIRAQHSGRSLEILADLVLVATGRSRRPRLPRKWISGPRLAIHGMVPGGSNDGAGPDVQVVAGEASWLWSARLPGGAHAAAIVLEPKDAGGAPLDEVFHRLSRRFRPQLGRDHQQGLERVTQSLHACGVGIAHSHAFGDDGLIAIGDAALLLDPLAAQGVQSALSTARQGAILADTLLRRPGYRHQAIAFYRSRITERAQAHARFRAQHYGRQNRLTPHPFWDCETLASDRGTAQGPRHLPVTAPAPETLVALDGDLRIESTAVIHEQLIQPLPALHHPRLERAVAFWNEVALAPIVAVLRDRPMRLSHYRAYLANRLGPEQGLRLLEWLLCEGLVVGAT